jgi:D-beta-D-heptose 7-phosphate kinase / D-beta-D-heptose 1-phosphate adenosyltransferase
MTDPLEQHLTALRAAIDPYRTVAARLADWGAKLAWHLGRGGRLLIAGNGGSAAEAQHLAAELVGKLREDRLPLSAIALTPDSSTITAISNDYGYEEVFARQVCAHGRPGDVLLVMSTSGRSPNLLAAVRAAAGRGVRTWAMTGPGANPLADACDEVLRCPSADRQVVQELHLVSVHVLCEHIDLTLPAVLGTAAPATEPMTSEPDGKTTSKLVIVGDTLLDRDIDGAMHRIAPDAPAPVLDEERVTERPGGAGLAALLATGHGRQVALITALADDAGGARLADLLAAAGVDVYALPLPGRTPEKVRLRSRGQVLLRLDRGGEPQPPGDVPEQALTVLRTAAAVLVSDYGRGVAGHPALRAALEQTAAPVVWDPHPAGPAPTPNTRLITPNLAEARAFTGDAGKGSTLTTAQRAGRNLRQHWRASAVAVTCGAQGAVLCHAGPTPLVVTPEFVADGDTCGAGDRFATTAALSLAAGALVSEAVQDAVAAASAYVSAGGVTAALASRDTTAGPERIGTDEAGRVIAEVRARGGTVVATGGCFDLLHAGHLATLRAARRLGDCLIACLNSDASVRGLKGPDRPLTGEADRARLLAALDCVDAVVIFDEPTPETVLTRLRPDVWVKGGDYADGGPELPEARLVERWGGHTAIVPYLDGRSTTRTIAAVQAATGRR